MVNTEAWSFPFFFGGEEGGMVNPFFLPRCISGRSDRGARVRTVRQLVWCVGHRWVLYGFFEKGAVVLVQKSLDPGSQRL